MQILPRFGDGFARVPPGGLVPGSTLRLRCDVLDDAGHRLAASGATCLLTRPDGVGLSLTPTAMDSANSAWDAGLAEFTGAGRWQVAWNFTGGTVVATVIEVKPATNPAPTLAPAPLITTQDLGPILTTQGGALTATRVNNLPAAAALDGSEAVLAVQSGAAKQATVAQMAAAAAAQVTPAGIGAATAAALASEATARAAADSTNAAAIAAETTRAQAAEAAILAEIGVVAARLKAGSLASVTTIAGGTITTTFTWLGSAASRVTTIAGGTITDVWSAPWSRSVVTTISGSTITTG